MVDRGFGQIGISDWLVGTSWQSWDGLRGLYFRGASHTAELVAASGKAWVPSTLCVESCADRQVAAIR